MKVHEANSDALCPDLHAVFSNPQLTVHHEIDDRRAESTAAMARYTPPLQRPAEHQLNWPSTFGAGSLSYDRDDLTLSLTGSEMGANASGLLLDRILDTSVQFLAGRYVAADVYVSQGVCFNRGEFVKERMLEQFESLLQLSISCWNKSNPFRKCARPLSVIQPSSNFSP